jgi:hypothetical protein
MRLANPAKGYKSGEENVCSGEQDDPNNAVEDDLNRTYTDVRDQQFKTKHFQLNCIMDSQFGNDSELTVLYFMQTCIFIMILIQVSEYMKVFEEMGRMVLLI